MMTIERETDINDVLEAYIDRFGMGALLVGLITVCDDKAIHVQEAWGDRVMARAWERMSNKLVIAANASKDCPLP